jgi:hypothetical protein
MVNSQGVSFTFDQTLAREVKSETIPASTEGKPSDIWPEHPAFNLLGYAALQRAPRDSAHMAVFEIAKFREAMRHAGEEMAKDTVPPTKEDWALGVDHEVRILKKLIASKPNQQQIKTVIGSNKTGMGTVCYGIPQVPFLPMWESCDLCRSRQICRLQNGKGLFLSYSVEQPDRTSD